MTVLPKLEKSILLPFDHFPLWGGGGGGGVVEQNGHLIRRTDEYRELII